MATTSTQSPTRFLPSRPPAMTTYPAGDTTVIAIGGGRGAPALPGLDHHVTAALERGGRHLVLDLHELPAIEPEALGSLWAAVRSVRGRGGSLAAAGARPGLRPALESLSSGGLRLHPTVRDALSSSHSAAAGL